VKSSSLNPSTSSLIDSVVDGVRHMFCAPLNVVNDVRKTIPPIVSDVVDDVFFKNETKNKKIPAGTSYNVDTSIEKKNEYKNTYFSTKSSQVFNSSTLLPNPHEQNYDEACFALTLTIYLTYCLYIDEYILEKSKKNVSIEDNGIKHWSIDLTGKVAILCFYRHQLKLVTALFKKYNEYCFAFGRRQKNNKNNDNDKNKINQLEIENNTNILNNTLIPVVPEICSVDEYQGRQSDVVILSLVYSSSGSSSSSPSYSSSSAPSSSSLSSSVLTPFLRDERRINVATSRARGWLCLLGDVNAMARTEEWETVLQKVKEKDVNEYEKEKIKKFENNILNEIKKNKDRKIIVGKETIPEKKKIDLCCSLRLDTSLIELVNKSSPLDLSIKTKLSFFSSFVDFFSLLPVCVVKALIFSVTNVIGYNSTVMSWINGDWNETKNNERNVKEINNGDSNVTNVNNIKKNKQLMNKKENDVVSPPGEQVPKLDDKNKEVNQISLVTSLFSSVNVNGPKETSHSSLLSSSPSYLSSSLSSSSSSSSTSSSAYDLFSSIKISSDKVV
jgi:hypothetical protein